MSMPVISLEEFDRQFETLRERMDADLYQKMCGTAVAVPGFQKLRELEPFSDAYREEIGRAHV